MHPNDSVINDYVDDEIEPRQRIDVEQHLQTCARCRGLVDDLREIRSVAQSLDVREPPVRAWTRLERTIKLEQPRARNRSTAPYLWLGAAAAIVLATVVVMRMTARISDSRLPAASATTTVSAQPGAASAQVVESELRAAEDHYEKAIKGLEQIANAEQNVFDPRTAATLQKNLAVIDQAIGESRAALRAQPDSEPAQQSLLENFKAKMALLQDTVSLINEVRKGNEAGAARIVSGLKERGN